MTQEREKTVEEFEDEVLAACERAIAEGWTIVKNATFIPDKKQCCGLGALLVGMNLLQRGCQLYRTAGLTDRQGDEFVIGFDFPDQVGPNCSAWTILGARISAKYCAVYFETLENDNE